jgi:hypothetical protein
VFVALVFVLLAQPKDFFQHLHIEAFAFGLGQNLLLPFIQRLNFFVDVLDALDKRANAIARYSHRVCHVSPRIDAEVRYGCESNRKVNGQWRPQANFSDERLRLVVGFDIGVIARPSSSRLNPISRQACSSVDATLG